MWKGKWTFSAKDVLRLVCLERNGSFLEPGCIELEGFWALVSASPPCFIIDPEVLTELKENFICNKTGVAFFYFLRLFLGGRGARCVLFRRRFSHTGIYHRFWSFLPSKFHCRHIFRRGSGIRVFGYSQLQISEDRRHRGNAQRKPFVTFSNAGATPPTRTSGAVALSLRARLNPASDLTDNTR